ncbi:GDSL esterase/lipase LTL1-like [Cynara cardunculus var. scolymus]|uniref:GDSL esterase/lipase LTL1-like n=1 Tax=Cynara cardunculus var. scolymus TaxID=59895 RepID=UPI000D62AA26|nr:GDSL esterase/lipase LTL1-like [Cynara cardunculus var. scolymus]
MASARRNLLLFVIFVAINGVTLRTVMAATGGYKTDAAIFIFGDSTADVGTNNHLKNCTARADHRYHGIDFPFSKPTGRYSNGKNAADQIAKLLGNYKISPPPFLSLLATHKSTFKRNLLRGANFASAGSGIFSATGQLSFHKVICLEEQIQQFATVRQAITELLDSPKAVDDLLQNSIYILSIGSNDLIEFELAGQPGGRDKFLAKLTETYAEHLADLYELGARKFAIIDIPPIGCCPAARAYNATGGCMQDLNDNARSFYRSMQSNLARFSLVFKGFKYSLGNTYAMTMNVIDNPRGNRFKEVKTACCGSGPFNGVTGCEVGANLCAKRSDFLFWDQFHPTETASELAALTLVYGEGSEYVTPMNFSSLAMAA